MEIQHPPKKSDIPLLLLAASLRDSTLGQGTRQTTSFMSSRSFHEEFIIQNPTESDFHREKFVPRPPTSSASISFPSFLPSPNVAMKQSMASTAEEMKEEDVPLAQNTQISIPEVVKPPSPTLIRVKSEPSSPPLAQPVETQIATPSPPQQTSTPLQQTATPFHAFHLQETTNQNPSLLQQSIIPFTQPTVSQKTVSQPKSSHAGAVQYTTDNTQNTVRKQHSLKGVKRPADTLDTTAEDITIHTHTLVTNKRLSDEEQKFALSYDVLLHIGCQTLLHRQHWLSTVVFDRPLQKATNADIDQINAASIKTDKVIKCIDALEAAFDITPNTWRYLTAAKHPGVVYDLEKQASHVRFRYSLLEFLNMVYFNPFDPDKPTLVPQMDALGWLRFLPAWLKLANLEVDLLYTGRRVERFRSNWTNLLLTMCIQVRVIPRFLLTVCKSFCRYMLCLVDTEDEREWNMFDIRETMQRFVKDAILAIPIQLPCLNDALRNGWHVQVIEMWNAMVDGSMRKFRVHMIPIEGILGEAIVPRDIIRNVFQHLLDDDVKEFQRKYLNGKQWLGEIPPSAGTFSFHETFYELVFRKVVTLAAHVGFETEAYQEPNAWKYLINETLTNRGPRLLRIAKLSKLNEFIRRGNMSSSFGEETLSRAEEVGQLVSGSALMNKILPSIDDQMFESAL